MIIIFLTLYILCYVGDLGQTEWTASTLKHVDKSDYDVFLLPGDLSYADSQQQMGFFWSFSRAIC
jgi:hypothetical protein